MPTDCSISPYCLMCATVACGEWTPMDVVISVQFSSVFTTNNAALAYFGFGCHLVASNKSKSGNILDATAKLTEKFRHISQGFLPYRCQTPWIQVIWFAYPRRPIGLGYRTFPSSLSRWYNLVATKTEPYRYLVNDCKNHTCSSQGQWDWWRIRK